MKISKKDLNKYLTPYFIKLYEKSFNDYHQVSVVSSKELLSPKRFDILIKYIYAWHKKNNVEVEYATEIYKHHIGVWNNFVEPDGSKKCFEDYLNNFNIIINNKFDSNCSLIPVSKEGVIIDGSHRTTSCILNQENPSIIVLDIPSPNYDYKYFRKLGTNEKVMDYAALKYTELDERLYLLFLFPVARNKDSEVEDIIQSIGEIAYSKELKLNENGILNLVIQSYRDEKWIGSQQDNYNGAKKNANLKYKENELIQTYLIKVNSYEDTLKIKKQIRSLFEYGNNSVHITDTHEETLRLAQQIYNENSINCLNFSKHCNNQNFLELFKNYKNKYLKLEYTEQKKFCIDSSSVLSVFGIRDCRDIDFLAKDENKSYLLKDKGIDCHNQELKYYPLNLDEMIFNPNNYFYYDGVKFLNLQNVRNMKSIRGEEKDLKDIELINNSVARNLISELWYSQNGEDFILNELLKNKNNGFFVEVGCIDGLRFSNTYKFEKKGWKGVCIEAHQDYIPFLQQNRPNSYILNYAVGEKDEDNVIFYANSRGSLSTLDKSQEEHFKNHYGKWFTGFKEQIVKKRTLNTIFDENNIKEIDVLSIDIEGYEIQALKGLDLTKYHPKVIVVESTGNEHEKELDDILLTNNYKKAFRLSENIFYIFKESHTTLLNHEYFIELLTTENPFDKEGNINRTIQLTYDKSKNEYFKKEISKSKLTLNKVSLTPEQKEQVISNLVQKIENSEYKSFSIYGIGELTTLLLVRLFLIGSEKRINYFIDSYAKESTFFHSKQVLTPEKSLKLGETNFIIVGFSQVLNMEKNLLSHKTLSTINIIKN